MATVKKRGMTKRSRKGGKKKTRKEKVTWEKET